jgi:feruloyl esterase
MTRILAITVAAAGLAATALPAAAQQTDCASLAGMRIPASAIGLPTTEAVVETAVSVAAGAADNPNGAYCAVKGFILPVSPTAPKMEFEVNLPNQWNRKAAQMGGGGYDGSLVTGLGPAALQPDSVRNPLARGYVTLGSDGGHKGGPGFDGAFALNAEALLNYGQQSVKKTHDVAMAIIRAHYDAVPTQFYFIGASQGGHEALDAAARYPADYDGVVANYPAYNITMLQLGSWNVGKALYENGGAGWLNPAKTRLLTDAVLAACDELDGARDGIISNVKACNGKFGIAQVRATLRCPDGRDAGDACLSDAQIAAVEKIAAPLKLPYAVQGATEFPGWAILEGSLFRGGSTFGTRAVPTNPPTGQDALLHNVGAAFIKYFVTQRPAFDALTFKPEAFRAEVQRAGAITDVTEVSLSSFRRKGGKIIMTHGTADDFISPHNSVDYYNRQLAAAGGQTDLDGFLRFYVIPGLSHGFGVFNAKYDGLGEIDRWVESGRAPGELVAVDGNKDARRDRPMCLFPAWPRYKGAGSIDSAASFACVTD